MLPSLLTWRRHRLSAAVLLGVAPVIALTGIGGRGAHPPVVPPARDVSAPLSVAGCATDRGKAPTRELTVHLGGPDGDRTALVHVPARAATTQSPVVVALHGGGATGPFMKRYSGLARVADRAGFTVVFPNATGAHRYWNLDPRSAPDDVGFIEALIERTATVACVDPARVFVVGVSNGGRLAARVGCELSQRVAGIVVVAGGFGHLPACHPLRPVSVMEIHGSDDPNYPYGGDPDDGSGNVRAWLEGWARRNGCGGATPPRLIAPRAVRLDWRSCARGTALAHIEVLAGGHQWPGATPPDPGPPSTFSAADQIWAFLAHLRSPPTA
jgi:polyhydroxybutyrate depolymerase